MWSVAQSVKKYALDVLALMPEIILSTQGRFRSDLGEAIFVQINIYDAWNSLGEVSTLTRLGRTDISVAFIGSASGISKGLFYLCS